MGSRYTKSIPEFIYFMEQNDGWYSGPFVKNPCKGKNANTDRLIICRVERLTKLVSEESQIQKTAKMVEVIAADVKKSNFFTPQQATCNAEDLEKLEKWLKTEEGIEKIRQAQISAEKFIESLGLNEPVDIKILREPFTI